ncbi:MAG: M81 family metallopeptidase [Bacillota bacterium]|jgi:microcystin degradation protein MlrC
MKIVVAEFSHETCTYCPDPTTIERLEPYVKRGQDVLDSSRGIPNYVNGFIQVAEAEGDVELVPVIRVGMAPGPYTSWWDRECYEKYAAEIVAGVEQAGEIDGVLLALHGAMAVRGIPKPEAEIVRRVRAVVGDKPIMVTLDLHANEDEELAAVADAVFVIKTYPHVDSQETGAAAARCMVETIRGRFQPKVGWKKPGIISASIYQASGYHPMKDLLDRANEWEQKENVYWVAIAPGFAYADVPDVGMSVVAITNGDQELADTIAQDIADLAWSLRASFSEKLPNPAEAVQQAMQHVASGTRPILLADGADRTGDSTHVLRELLRQGAKNFAIPGISDPKATHFLAENHQVGDQVTVKIGGWASEFSGEPVEVTGIIKYIGRPEYVLVGPMRKGARVKDGLVVLLDLGDNRNVVVSERMRGSNDSSGLTSVGIDVDSLDIVILKDRVHHRAFWDSVCKVDIRVDAPGIGVADLSQLHYENIPDDIYPIGKNCPKE